MARPRQLCKSRDITFSYTTVVLYIGHTKEYPTMQLTSSPSENNSVLT